jgi:hypothetical protein
MIGQQEACNVNIQSEQSRAIEQVVDCLKSFERPAITCSLLVSPAETDADGSFEWPVVDTVTAEFTAEVAKAAVSVDVRDIRTADSPRLIELKQKFFKALNDQA